MAEITHITLDTARRGRLQKLFHTIDKILPARESNVDRGNFSGAIDQKRGRQRVHAAVHLRGRIVAHDHAVV